MMGSIGGTIDAETDLIPPARAAEALSHKNLFNYPHQKLFVKKMCITVTKDCSISINGGSDISIKAQEPYAVDNICAHSIVLKGTDVQYVFDYGY